MIWYICFVLSLSIFIISVFSFIICIKKSNNRKIREGINILLFSTIFSAFLLCLPIEVKRYTSLLDAVLVSFRDMLQIFSLDSSFREFYEDASISNQIIKSLYIHFGAFLHIIAPILTIGFLLTFFKSVMSYTRLYFGRYKKLYAANHSSLQKTALKPRLS